MAKLWLRMGVSGLHSSWIEDYMIDCGNAPSASCINTAQVASELRHSFVGMDEGGRAMRSYQNLSLLPGGVKGGT